MTFSRMWAEMFAILHRMNLDEVPPQGGFGDRIIYEGMGWASCDWGPHYSRTTRMIYITVGDAIPSHPILVAEVSIATADAIAAAGDFTRVWVKVHQRIVGDPRVVELRLMPSSSQQERLTEEQSPPIRPPVVTKDHYGALGVKRNASPADIKAAFRKLAFACHPDLFPNDPQKEARFKEINEAHEVLSDPTQRANYDLTLPPE